MPDPPQHDDPAKTLDYHYLPILAQRQEKTADRSSSSLAGAKRPDTVDVEESDGPEEVRHFDHLLTFPDEIAPVFEGLLEEQEQRRLLDHVRNREVTRVLDRLNDESDVAIRERQESDILLDRMANTRLDAVQRKLFEAVKVGFEELHAELDEAKERLRLNTEKLHQVQVDADIERDQLMVDFHSRMDRVSESLQHLSEHRLKEDLAARQTIPAPILEVWRLVNDAKDIWPPMFEEHCHRLLPLEHSDLNDIDNSVAQQKIRHDLEELLAAIHSEVQDRIAEEKAQAAKAKALTDALTRGLRTMNASSVLPSLRPPAAAAPEVDH